MVDLAPNPRYIRMLERMYRGEANTEAHAVAVRARIRVTVLCVSVRTDPMCSNRRRVDLTI